MNRVFLPLLFVLFISCGEMAPPAISLSEDVAFLASDSLKGRETGSPGELAAAFI